MRQNLLPAQEVSSTQAWDSTQMPGARYQLVTLAQLKKDCDEIDGNFQDEEERKRCQKEREIKTEQITDESNLALVDSVNAFARAGHSSSGDGALIIFAVIGVVVLIVWIPYVLAYLYQWIAKGESAKGWWQLELLYTAMSRERLSSDTQRSGGFLGLRGSLFMGEDSGQQMILVVEGGRVDFEEVILGQKREYQAGYLMAGPGLSFGSEQTHFGLQIIGGTADSRAIGLLSKATGFFKINFNPWLFSLDLGALYSNIHSDRGAARDIDGFQFVGSVGFGLSF